MNKEERKRYAEMFDEALDEFDLSYDYFHNQIDDNASAEDFKRKYKEFYTDIKISRKEDW